MLLTLGTFDCPHLGHAIFLNRCRKLDSRVVVGVNTDQFVESFKGRKPFFTLEERMGLIRQFGFETVPNPSSGKEIILRLRPQLLAIGADWACRDYHGQIGMSQEHLDLWGVTLVYVAYQPLISTSRIIERIRRPEGQAG